MTHVEIRAQLAEKIEAAWAAYQESMAQLPSHAVFEKAGEIEATRLCREELVRNGGSYPDHLLEHLLSYSDPLEVIREQSGGRPQ